MILATIVEIGDNLVVNVEESNEEGASFWLVVDYMH
jgi:hypothetical protein